MEVLNKVACLVVVVLLCMVVVAPPPYAAEGAISCGQVHSSLSRCIDYLTKGGTPRALCCSGVRYVNNAARTTPDRQLVCRCLKSVVATVRGIKPALAASLPGRCRVNVPYKISTSIDCSKVR